MKLKLLILLLLGVIANTMDGMVCGTFCNISDHTTLVPRLMAENSVLELALHNYYDWYHPECSDCRSWVNVEITAPYYFKSTREKRLAGYFLPNCQNCITIGKNNTSDISSPWLELFSAFGQPPFSSTVCIAPTRKVIGGALRLFFDFGAWSDNCGCMQDWWATIFIPVQQVRHNLHLTEIPTPGSGAAVYYSINNAIEALNNPAWLFGKWSPTTLKKSGVDDISVKVGYTFHKSAGHAAGYGLLFIPTGRGTKAEYLFEPLVGGNHVGLGLGFNGDYLMYDCGSTSIDLMLDIRYAYFFKRKETRSIDLFNGDLSRYLLVAQSTNTTAALPGINYFTQQVSVIPGSMLELWTGISFNRCNWHVEVGYDFWFRSKEKLSLADEDLGVGIFDIAARPPTCPVTASCARICQAIPGTGAPTSDTTFTTVSNSNAINEQGVTPAGTNCCTTFCAQPNQCSYLNLNSAANPRALTSTVYGAISYDCCVCDYPAMIGVGGQYEFAHRRSALSQYGVWLKTAISF